jgi:UDP-2,3-diacylglucosamine hydrolase
MLQRSIWPVVSPPVPLLAIADLHLDLAETYAGSSFASWAANLGPVGSLVILGDLFDVWIGPAQMTLPGAPLVLDALRGLTDRGARVYVVPGNRDFLLDAAFEKRTGARIFPEGFVTPLPGGGRAVFVHGDTLCTKDHAYQRLRRVLRSRTVRTLAPRLPLPVGMFLARRLRRSSTRAVARKLSATKELQRDAVARLAETADAQLVVCGHVHEARDEAIGARARLVVLSAFGAPRDALVIDTDGPRAATAGQLAGAFAAAARPPRP